METEAMTLKTVETTIHLHWQGIVDLDLMAISVDAAGNSTLISFAKDGDTTVEPYLQLLGDFQFSEVPVDNQEIIRFCPTPEYTQRVWLWCWDFAAIEEGLSIMTAEDVFIEFQQAEQRRVTAMLDVNAAKTGNAVCFGYLDVHGEEMTFCECMHLESISLLDDVGEVKERLLDAVQALG